MDGGAQNDNDGLILSLAGTNLIYETGGMNPLRLLVVVVGFSLLGFEHLLAQAGGTPFTPDKQYSSDEVLTPKVGTPLTMKEYTDNGKVRTEMSMHGMQVIAIIRPDQLKAYSVLPAQKMVMVNPYDPTKVKIASHPTPGVDAKFEVVGPDTLDGVACTKYKVTSLKENKVFFWWVNNATNAPVKMMAEDGSFSLAWSNYKAGPQDPALFEPPAGYQVMNAPQMPGMPGGAGQ
jgi:hypothetical protein